MQLIKDLLPLFFFLTGGLIFLYLVITKYTEEAHQKEIKKNKWMKKDYYNYENPIFYRIMSNSFWIAKALLIIASLIPIVIGILILWSMYQTYF
ncbi:hypothetical protein [Pontibacillus marinus]|uniref:Uncharacterized protein n=1 Tax=Pontibacillus marinus BH030004 = DSM 16465 TaxID=1385511 RepID=A0A0A5FW06_9BACI|nr:hypothetical protein [Pontibacillus marinus]KGX83203.1 hypothetical protein N783_05745 [Pontibacillus marinus BH030004 = DSM 16465]